MRRERSRVVVISVDGLVKRFLSPAHMVKQEHIKGPLPSLGEALRVNLSVAWASVLEAVLIALMTSVDTMMVGGMGEEAIAAVGITSQPKFILLALVMSLNVGITAVIARRRGEDDRAGAIRSLKQGVLLSAGISIVMTGVGIAFARPILLLAGAESGVIDMAVKYFQLTTIGNFFASIGMTINSAQRGIGNTRITMRTNITANILNVLFNYLLIHGIWIFPRLGIVGAGVSTIVGNVVACGMSILSVWRIDGYLTVRQKGGWKPQWLTLKSVYNVASSAFVEQFCMRVGFFLYAMIVARLGTTALATHQICMQIISVSFAFGDGFGIASTSLVGQSLGAGRPDLAMIYGKVGQRLALLMACLLFFVFFFGRNFWVGIFNDSPAVITLGSQIMVIISIACLAQTSQVVLSGCLRGAGDSRYVAWVSLLSVALIRPLISWVLCYPVGMGLIGAWIGLAFDQFLRLVLNLIRFGQGKWARIKL